MVTTWILKAGLTILGWVLSLFDFLPELSLPAPFAITVPVPFLSTGTLSTWFLASVAVAGALIGGKALQWLYSLIPFKAT